MSYSIQDNVNKIFGLKDDYDDQVPEVLRKVNASYGKEIKEYNPFLDKNGEIFNKYINYQQILDNPDISTKAKEYITKATGLEPTPVQPTAQNAVSYESYSKSNGIDADFVFNADADENNLASLDITTDLPKLSTSQIEKIISQHFPNSTVIKPSDASGIYNAQQQSGMSALAILGIGALESGYGTSNIAKQKNNIWGWNATNVNPSGNATSFSQMSQGALEFANNYMNTYYNGYGAKSIASAGTGNNPKGMGYAYNNNGSINTAWASDVGSIMKNFYNTAKSVAATNTKNTVNAGSNGNGIVNSAKNYIGTPYVWGGESIEEGGMDCSGFVYAALKGAGYNVGRTTAEGYRQMGTAVNKSSLQPGDLIFYGSGSNATHVGIYIGNGQMIHSSGGSSNTKSNPGKGVSIQNIDYRSDYLGAKRLK